ncbi:hypothetical protein [Vibrio celticus]|nr:hypothetical protein [Vibrio celticus]
MFYSKRFTIFSGIPIVGEVFNMARKSMTRGNMLSGIIGLVLVALTTSYTAMNPFLVEELFKIRLPRGWDYIDFSNASAYEIIAWLPAQVIGGVGVWLFLAVIGVCIRCYSPYVKAILDGSAERNTTYYAVCTIVALPLAFIFLALMSFSIRVDKGLEMFCFLTALYAFFVVPFYTTLVTVLFGVIGFARSSLSNSKTSLEKHIDPKITSNLGGKVLLGICALFWLGCAIEAVKFGIDPNRQQQNIMTGYSITCLCAVVLFYLLHFTNPKRRTRTVKGLFFTSTKEVTVFEKMSAEEIAAVKEQLKVSFFVCGANVGAMTYVAWQMMGISFDSAIAAILSFAVAAIAVQTICAVIANISFEEVQEGRFGIARGLKPLIYIAPTLFVVWGTMNF